MEIRKTVPGDLERILELYENARKLMRESGNPNQWGDHYPPRELVCEDIRMGRSYCLVQDGKIAAVFVYFFGEDPTYRVIEDGAWLNDRPYGVLHRIASDGTCKGAGSFCIQWCLEQCKNLRGDTHKDNHIMQHVMEKNGLIRCGKIYLEDGTERIAYQREIRAEKDE